MFDYDRTIASIYDCAANPELWPETLANLRDLFQGEFAELAMMKFNFSGNAQEPVRLTRDSGWETQWLDRIPALVRIIPGSKIVFHAEQDQPWSRLTYMDENEFKKTEFYNIWSRPQKLKDCINIRFLKRSNVSGMFTVTRSERKQAFTFEECALAARLTPHIRRAVLINELSDNGRLAQTLYEQVLDQLSTAVFVLGAGQKLAFTNSAGDELLSEGNFLTTVAGALQAHRTAGLPAALEDTLNRAAKGDAAVGISGIGIPLIGKDGERAAAYVLPIAGKDLRGAIGQGLCVMFIARRGEQQPMALEMLRTMFDLTVMEARVSLLLAQGQGPQSMAEGLKLSVNTVRSRLKHAYAKTGTADQIALSALIHAVLPPVRNP